MAAPYLTGGLYYLHEFVIFISYSSWIWIVGRPTVGMSSVYNAYIILLVTVT